MNRLLTLLLCVVPMWGQGVLHPRLLSQGGATNGQVLAWNTANGIWQPTDTVTGTVTSVGLVGTANQLTVTGTSPITTSGSWTISIPTNPTLPGTTTGTFSGNLTGNVTGNVTGTAATFTGNLTGDVTSVAMATTLVNIPTATTMAGYVATTAIVAPGTPGAGVGRIYIDSTSKNIAVKDDAGTIKHGVQTKSVVASSFLTAIDDAGAVTAAQPAFTDISGAATDAQVPNTITIDLATVATTANAGDSATAFFSSGALEDAIIPNLDTLSTGLADNTIPRINSSGNLATSKLTCTVSPVTCTLYDDTATTGASMVVVREGAVTTNSAFSITDSSGLNGVGLRRGGAGILKTTNASSTDYFFFDGPNLAFSAGGVTAGFPQWRRNAASWDARLADNSAYANVRGAVADWTTNDTDKNAIIVRDSAGNIGLKIYAGDALAQDSTYASIRGTNGTPGLLLNPGTGGEINMFNGVAGNLILNNVTRLHFGTRTALDSPADGDFRLRNAALTALSTLDTAPGGTTKACAQTAITTAELNDADTEEDEALFTIAANGTIDRVWIKSSTVFAGVGIATLTVRVGTTGTPDAYSIGSYDLLAAVADTNYLDSRVPVPTTAASHAVIARFASTGANLADLTSGSVTIGYCYDALQ